MSCSAQGKYNKDATITGTLSNAENQNLVLERLSSVSATFIDSTRVNDKGLFSFDLKVEQPGFYRISIDKRNFLNIILDKAEKVHIKSNAENLGKDYDVTGSKETTRLLTLNKELSRFYVWSDSLQRQAKTVQQSGDMNAFMALQQQFQQGNMQHKNFIYQFIDENPGSIAALATVQKLDPEQDIAYFKKIANGLNQSMPGSDYATSFNDQVSKMSVVGVGMEAPDITLNDLNDKPLSLSSLRGKVVLLDFWASWCRPCRAENPNVVKMYNKYKDKGFEILGVSLDTKKGAWQNAIQQDGLTWLHISDLKGWKSSVVPQYKVQGIPYTVLIDKDGKIIAKKLRGAQLERKLQEVLGG